MNYSQWFPFLLAFTFLPSVPLIWLVHPVADGKIPKLLRSGGTLAACFALDAGRRLLLLATGVKIISPPNWWLSVLFLFLQGLTAIVLWIRLGLELNARAHHHDLPFRYRGEVNNANSGSSSRLGSDYLEGDGRHQTGISEAPGPRDPSSS